MSEPKPDDLIGLVPAAGSGLRLGLPYPKELYPIIRDNKYKPVAQHILENMTASGVEHIVFVINETKHQLIGYFGDGHRFGCHNSYVVQERAQKPREGSSGLAQALDAGYHLTQGKTVVFGMADTIITPVDVFVPLLASAYQDADVVLALFETDNPQKFGMVVLNQGGIVRQIVDKPAQSDLRLMWGCMVWRPSFTEFLHRCLLKGEITDFADIMNAAIEAGLRFRGVVIPGGSYADVGTYDEIARLEREYRANIPECDGVERN